MSFGPCGTAMGYGLVGLMGWGLGTVQFLPSSTNKNPRNIIGPPLPAPPTHERTRADALKCKLLTDDTYANGKISQEGCGICKNVMADVCKEVAEIEERNPKKHQIKVEQVVTDFELKNSLHGDEKPIKKIIVMIAMSEEAEGFLKKLGFNLKTGKVKKHPLKDLGGDVYTCTCTGTAGEINVTVVCSGSVPFSTRMNNNTGEDVRDMNGQKYSAENVSTTPAAALATLVCREKPDLVINAGTAGGWKRARGKIGKIFIPDFIQNHDRQILDFGPGFSCFGTGLIKVPTKGLRNKLREKLGEEICDQGVSLCSTGASFNSAVEYQKIIEFGTHGHAHLKEMEAASIGWVCQKYGQPYIMIKSITDMYDVKTDSALQFQTNMETARTRLCEALITTLTFLTKGDGKTWEVEDMI